MIQRQTLKEYRDKRRKRSSFNPNRAFINEAVELYLNNGGKINQIEINQDSYGDFIKKNDYVAVNEFLNGE
jgi:hypothetical protein